MFKEMGKKTKNTKETKKPSKLYFGKAVRSEGLVIVEVGSQRVKYRIHKAFLTHHSHYFASALDEKWEEGQNRKVTLEDAEPGIFNVFANYVYGQAMPKNVEDWINVTEPGEISNDEAEQQRFADAHIKAICLADRLIAPRFKGIIHNNYAYRIVGSYNIKGQRAPSYRTVIYAFEQLPPGDPLLKLFVDLQAWFWKET